MLLIIGLIAILHLINNQVGRGSRQQLFFGDLCIIVHICCSVTSLEELRVVTYFFCSAVMPLP